MLETCQGVEKSLPDCVRETYDEVLKVGMIKQDKPSYDIFRFYFQTIPIPGFSQSIRRRHRSSVHGSGTVEGSAVPTEKTKPISPVPKFLEELRRNEQFKFRQASLEALESEKDEE